MREGEGGRRGFGCWGCVAAGVKDDGDGDGEAHVDWERRGGGWGWYWEVW